MGPPFACAIRSSNDISLHPSAVEPGPSPRAQLGHDPCFQRSHNDTLAITLLPHIRPRHPGLLLHGSTLPQILQALPCFWEILARSPPVPPLRVLDVAGGSDPNLSEVAHRVLRLREPGLCRFACPQVRFRVGLLKHAFASRQVPARQGQFGLVFFLHGRFAVPGYGLAGIDDAAELAVLIGGAEAELGEFVAELGRLEEELFGAFVVFGNVDVGRWGLVEEGLCVRGQFFVPLMPRMKLIKGCGVLE